METGILEDECCCLIGMPESDDMVRRGMTPILIPTHLDSSKPINWDEPRGDLIKRAYWHCTIIETYAVLLVP
jgi:hypothetical protein